MPVDWEGCCKRILEDIETTSQSIRRSALAHANDQNFEISERLRHELEIIRVSADAILGAIAKASITDYTIDSKLIDWLFSGELYSCLGKLKEMDTMFKLTVDLVRPVRGFAPLPGPGEDKLTAAMVFFDRHKGLFHSLITPDVWNRERLLHQPSRSEGRTPQMAVVRIPGATVHRAQGIQTSDGTLAGYTVEPNVDCASKTRHQKESHGRQLEEIIRWLAALNCADKHNYMYQLRQKGTCKWFPDTDVYGKWRTCGAQFLWLHGKAGCGKSVLAASTIESLKTTLQYEEVVVFFYFDFQNERSRSPVEMMRSLLSQLCRHLLDLGKKPGVLSDLDRLRSFVSCAADRFVREPIVVIDALEECEDVESLLHALVVLRDDDKIRLLVTSRPHEGMMRHFAKFSSLSFEDVATELAADIKLHIEREINHNQLKFAGPEMKREIHAKLRGKAEGRFRWVQCQIDIIKRCATAQELKKALDNLPTELEATYERILDAIDERRSEGRLARRVLAWLMVALEPLRLAQITDTLSVDFPSQQNVIRQGVELIHMLSSLVSHYKETDVVSLSHFSVKEYLTSRTTLPMYQIILYEAHAEAVQSCMGYLSAFIKQAPSQRSVVLSESWPMLSYVFSSGFNHLTHIDPNSIVVLDALHSLGSDIHHHPSHWDRLCQLREEDNRMLYPPWPSSRHDLVLYVLIAYASNGLFHTFLSHRHPVKARRGTNPLVYAADLRKTNHAIALLSSGADANTPSLAIDDSHHVLPLEVSIDRDEDVLVGELLQNGCLVTSELFTVAVCYPWCSARVLVKLTQTDDFVEWAHTMGDEKLYRSIFSSARPNAGDTRKADENHVALARRLRQIGQGLSADNPYGAELIERALHAAHTSMLDCLLPADRPPPAQFLLTASTGDTTETVSIVHYLLGRGADINVVSKRGDTVLHLAAMCPWEPRSLELTKMLTDSGCSPHVPNLWGETPLAIAKARNYSSVIEHLLSCNIPPPSCLLLNALKRCFHPTLVQQMVRDGADVNVTSDGKTVLHLAITKNKESSCLELVRSFIKAGCNTTVCNSKGETALHVAIEHRYTHVVRLLLSHNAALPSGILPFALQRSSSLQLIQLLIHRGADVHSASTEGETTLHLVIANYSGSACLELVRSLVGAGGNTSVRNSMGKTVLHAAIEHKYISVVEFLLSLNHPLPHDILPFVLQRFFPFQLARLLICNGANVHSTSSEGETIFHLAVSNYNETACLELVKSLVEAGGNTGICNSMGKTVLHVAIEHKYISVVEFLLSQRLPLPHDILPFALQQFLPFHLVRLLIRNGGNVHSTSPEGESIFHLAISNYDKSASLGLVRSLVKAGGNTGVCNSMGKTVLHAAIEHGNLSVVELLLSQNHPLPHNILPFALQQVLPFWYVQLLVCNGANVHSTSSDGETIFHLAIANYNESVCLEFMENFIGSDGDPTICNLEGMSPLESAIEHGYNDVVDFLLDGAIAHSAILNVECSLLLLISGESESTFLHSMKNLMKTSCNTPISNSTRKTVLCAAIKHGYTSVVSELLLSRIDLLPRRILPFALRQCSPPQLIRLLTHSGANLHSTSSKGETIFTLAVANYNESICLELVQNFIEAGGNTNDSCNSMEHTALYNAIECAYPSVVELLLSHNDLPPGILPFAIQRCSSPQLVQLLVRNGIDVHSTTPKSIFHLAIANYNESACLELMKSFVKAGGNPTACNSEGTSTLAILESSESTCLHLVENLSKADCNANTCFDSTRKTVLNAAIKRGYLSVVELLLSHNVPLPIGLLPFALQHCLPPSLVQRLIRYGADVHCTIPEGETIFHLAVANYDQSECLELVESFIEAGCSANVCNSTGKTVLDAAVERGYNSVVGTLLSQPLPTFPHAILHARLPQYPGGFDSV